MIELATRKYINSNFRIRIYGKTQTGLYIDRLVGISGLFYQLSDREATKCITRALRSQESKIRIKIYKSYTVTFYQK